MDSQQQEKVDELYFIKMKIFHVSKTTTKKVKRHKIGENICSHISAKNLYPE